MNGNRHGEIFFPILDARADDPRLSAKLVHADNCIFVLLFRRELAILDAAPASAHRGFGERRLELGLQFLLRRLGCWCGRWL